MTDPRPASNDNETQARQRARRRLIGAGVLLAIGVIGFPLLFETKPRPVPADVPAVQPLRERPVAADAQPKVVERPAATAAVAASAAAASTDAVGLSPVSTRAARSASTARSWSPNNAMRALAMAPDGDTLTSAATPANAKSP